MTGNQMIVDYLLSVPAWFLATSQNNQPHVRPFSFVALEGGRIWFCTAKTKDVYEELRGNPLFELSAWKPGSGWLIVRGKADLHDDVSTKVRMLGYEHMQNIGEHYCGPNDPALTFFSFTEGQGWIADIDGSKKVLDL